MKGILLFDNINDLAFLKTDKSLRLHLISLAEKEGLVNANAQDYATQNLQKDVVLQLFAPMLASFKIMQSEFGEKYHLLETSSEVLMLFQEVLNYVVIGIRKAKEMSTLIREVKVFSVYGTMLYGPSLYLLKEHLTIQLGVTRLQLLSLLLDKWHQVRADMQMFLVEAVERFIVKPEVTARCVNFLQDILHKLRTSNKKGIFSHSFLLVDYKLLALYSSRNSKNLPKVQLLLLIILANVLKEKMNDTSQSAPAPGDEPQEEIRNINSLLVFLETARGKIVPHIIHVISISQQVTLVILCEMMGKGVLSDCIITLSEYLHNLTLHPLCRLPLPSFHSLNSTMKKLYETTTKIKLQESEEKYIKSIINKWETAKQCGLEDYLKNSTQDQLELKLESAISSFCEACKVGFGEVITRPALTWEENCLEGEYKDMFSTVFKMSSKQLKSHIEYLDAGSIDDNLLMQCTKDFPGLVNFMYIDRTNDYIIAQSPVPMKDFNDNANLKRKVWEMVDFGWDHVNGIDSFFCLWHKEHLRYFYSLWFEDAKGKRIVPTASPHVKDLPVKGILCGNFYKILLEKCFPTASYAHIYCYEFFCIHLETTAAADVLEHARLLTIRLWKHSGIYKNPLDVF